MISREDNENLFTSQVICPYWNYIKYLGFHNPSIMVSRNLVNSNQPLPKIIMIGELKYAMPPDRKQSLRNLSQEFKTSKKALISRKPIKLRLVCINKVLICVSCCQIKKNI